MISRAEFKPLETAYRNYEANATVKNAADFLDEAGKVQAKAVGGGYSIESPYSRVSAAIEADFAARQGANGEILSIEAPDSITVRPDIDGGELVGNNGGAAQGFTGIFTSSDKYVGETANAIEVEFPDRVVGVNRKVYKPDGATLTDFDIELDNVVIKVKSGSGKGLTAQMVRTVTGTDKVVIGYAPDLNPSSALVRGARAAGFEVFTSWEELLAYLLNH